MRKLLKWYLLNQFLRKVRRRTKRNLKRKRNKFACGGVVPNDTPPPYISPWHSHEQWLSKNVFEKLYCQKEDNAIWGEIDSELMQMHISCGIPSSLLIGKVKDSTGKGVKFGSATRIRIPKLSIKLTKELCDSFRKLSSEIGKVRYPIVEATNSVDAFAYYMSTMYGPNIQLALLKKRMKCFIKNKCNAANVELNGKIASADKRLNLQLDLIKIKYNIK